MFSVWLCDLPKVIEALKEKVPNLSTFCSIRGNFMGDFVIENEFDKWIVKHNDFSVWHLDRTLGHYGEWVQL